MFSSVTGRGEFTFHILILGPIVVCAVSCGKNTFFNWNLGLSEVCTYKHSEDNINNGNDDKIVDVENIVKSENATRIMLRCKSCLKTIKANKPEPEDASHDKV